MTTLIVPEFITSKYINNILLKNFEGEQEKLSLVDFSIEPGTKKGENFASQVLRAKVKYARGSGPTEEISFFIKSKSEASEVAEFLQDFDIFRNEAYVYQEILSKFHKFYPECKIAPKLIFVDDNSMVFEDLNLLNFTLTDRKQKLSLNKTKCVLKKLAKFHAFTANAAKKDENLMKNNMANAIVSETDNLYHFFFTVCLMETLETVKGIPELARFVESMENYDIVAVEREIFTRNSDGKFLVLNHGDMWTNNLMFKCDEFSTDVVLVDYQECIYGSPGIDLNHFLYTACDLDVLLNNCDELIIFYHNELCAALHQLKFEKIPSLAEIRHEFDIKADQAFVVTCSNVPLLLIENTDHANPESFLAETEEAAIIRRQIWTNPKYVETLKVLLPLLESRKIFNRK